MKNLSIIIPIFNEIKTIEDLLKKVLKINVGKQLIVVDDGSKDGSIDILKKYKKKIDKIIIHKKNQGKGAAIRSGQKYVKGKYVVIQDADLEYNPSDIIKLLRVIKKKKLKAIYGSRVLNKKKKENTQNFTARIRIFANFLLTKISNYINNQNLTDAHTCYKMFESKLFKKIKLKENGFAFCPEVTTKISKMNIKISEFPISYKGRTYDEGKKITFFDGLDALYVLIKFRYFK